MKTVVFTKSYELCGKPQRLYKTNFESPSVLYHGCFAMPGAELRTKEKLFIAHHFSIDNTSQVPHTSLNFGEVNGNWVGAHSWRSVGADEIDYNLHLGNKLEYIMYFNSKQLRHSEMTLSRNHFELERTRMLTI